MWQRFIKDYLTFSKKDRIAILTLIGLIAVVATIPIFFPKQKSYELSEEDFAFVEIQREKSSKKNENKEDQNYQAPFEIDEERNSVPKISYFYFDPNTISVSQWQQLGVSERTANTIRKYVLKGGKFRQPEDLFKIYTLDDAIAAKLIPYVKIRESEKMDNESRLAVGSASKEEVVFESTYPKKEYHAIDINTADTTALKSLPGIGSFRAKMIVNLRDSILGFQSADELQGRWFLPDSVFRKLKPYFQVGAYTYPPLNINTTTLEELEKHPLFGKEIGKVIISYREQHGTFSNVADLQYIHVVDDVLFEKIKSFVVVR